MRNLLMMCALATSIIVGAGAARAEDAAKKACFPDAKRLCPQAVKAMSRRGVEMCLAARVEQTSPSCHAMILQVRDQRATAQRRKLPAAK